MFSNKADPLAGMRCLWVTNEGARDITLNSILTLLDVAPDLSDRIYVGCIDQESVDYFSEKRPDAKLIDISTSPDWLNFAQVGVEGEYGEYGSNRFRDVSFARYFALMALMEQEDGPVLYADGDIAFSRDPRPALSRAAQSEGAGILMQNDINFLPTIEHDDDGHAINLRPTRRVMCTGFVCWSNAARARAVAQRIIDGRDLNVEGTHDQKVLNKIPLEELQDLVRLPEEIFLNGSYLFGHDGELKFSDEVTEQRLAKACIVHANWMVGMPKKIAALQKVGLWQLDDRFGLTAGGLFDRLTKYLRQKLSGPKS